MRKLNRVDLPAASQSYLQKKQAEVNSGSDLKTTWENARKTKRIQGVFLTLMEMTGKRCRCMYCEDSRGTTIEHFWPKAKYREKAFVWKNLLLLCQGCQNHKGSQFRLGSDSEPLLIDPTSEDPWDFLYYESRTGLIVARYDSESDCPSPKGEHTTHKKTLPLNIEAVSEGRARTTRNLNRAVRQYLELPLDKRETMDSIEELVDVVQDHLDYGLVVWFFLRDGRNEPPFCRLESECPRAWSACISKLELSD